MILHHSEELFEQQQQADGVELQVQVQAREQLARFATQPPAFQCAQGEAYRVLPSQKMVLY